MRRAIAVALAIPVLFAAPPLQAQERGEGPTTLFITYQCKPERRAAFRSHMAEAGIGRFESWKKDGTVKDYLVLFSSYVNDATWDMLVRLDFARYADTEKWTAVERAMPGGLSADGLALCSPVASILADLEWEAAERERAVARARYVVIPYQLLVSVPAYKDYFAAYVKPQFDGWMADKALTGYGGYLNQHPPGPPWDALIILEYADVAALARRDVVKDAVRKRLAADPAWKKASDAKLDLRREEQVVLAEAILPH